ncbi:MAG: sigma-70 family RNA polymerase sigma factor [Verrucomicrobia bacterium]|nr:sigma-70 family RNA polymerase sigma factor [Verrucomicrobiota bacterium]
MTEPASSPESTTLFEQHREFLRSLAYRLLGTASDADDIVQETYLRWAKADRSTITEPRAYLARIATRLCLDHLKSARVRRETYVGQWLPEPVVQAAGFTEQPAGDLAHDISYALMLALERLSPLERATFLLHDVFGLPFDEIAETLHRSPATCRQLATRARGHVRAARPRFTVPDTDSERIAALFMQAAQTGDVGALSGLLAHDAIVYSDGGSFARAARRPILGVDRITRFFAGLAARHGPAKYLQPTPINGQPGFVKGDGTTLTDAYAFEIGHGVIVALYIVRNPEKLRHLAARLGSPFRSAPPEV